MEPTVRPFLMFTGRAEEAMRFYVSLFPGAQITRLERWGAGGPGEEGKVLHGAFTIGDQTIRCNDSPPVHAFTFTPSFSLFVDCASIDEVARLADALAAGGGVLMPRGDYGFSRQFAWVNDRFGVSWQLNCP
jgi:predicted 3-demethylubiquinone-9 3-methyltransferase (glyoxalase superfamily)